MYKPPPAWLRLIAIPLFPLLLLQGALWLLFGVIANKLPNWLALPFVILMLPVNLVFMLPILFAQNLYVWVLNSFNTWRDSPQTGSSLELRNPCWSCGYLVNVKNAVCPMCRAAVSLDERWTEVTS